MPSNDPAQRTLAAQKYRAANAALLAEKRKERRAAGKDKPHSGPSKSHTQPYKSKFDRGQFVVWDGEGITIHGATQEEDRHLYTLLAYKAWDGRSGKIENKKGLATYVILDFMASVSLGFPHSIHCGFSLGYDINKILTDCFPEQLQAIKESSQDERNAPYIAKYQVIYRNRRQFIMRWHPRDTDNRWLYKIGQDGKKKFITKSFELWDVFGFFQMSFVKTIEAWLGKDYPALAMIREQKALRSSFKQEDAQEVETYCFAELDALLEIMARLRQYCIEMGLTLKRWDGAGAVAAAYLSQIKITEHIGDIAPEVEKAARYAYFGGRIELMLFGHHGRTIYHDDVNSAYPTALQFCPSLSLGRMVVRQNVSSRDLAFRDFTLCHITWQATEEAPFYPFPYRASDGTITYPSHGEGWYWAPEICAARDNFRGQISIIEGYCYESEEPPIYPFAAPVQALYALRQQWKKAGYSAEKVAKLTLVSLYGKVAQKIANRDRKSGLWKKPTFHNLLWAGYTTSFTRATIYSAATKNPPAIIMFQTDGICSTEPLDLETSESKELGLWEHDTYDWITCVQSGVYWYEQKGRISEYVRGFDADKEEEKIREREASIRQAWQSYSIRNTYDGSLTSYPASLATELMSEGDRGVYPWQLTRFVTMGSCVSRLANGEVKKHEKLWARWGKFYRAERDLQLGPQGTKRLLSVKGVIEPWQALVPTQARSDDVDGISTPYKRPWDNDGSDLPPEDEDGIPYKIILDEKEDYQE